MSEWQRKIYGDAHVDQREALKQRLAEIETKHLQWFADRPGKDEMQEHDELSNYILMTFDATNIQMGISADLPSHIEQECKAAFKEIFP